MLQLSKEQIEEILNDAKPSIVEGIKNNVVNSMTYDVRESLLQLVKAEVQEFVKTEIIPELQKELIESKQGLVSVAVNFAPVIVEELTKSMAESVKVNLESSWKRKEILTKLFD